MNADIVDLGLARGFAAAGLLTGFMARPGGGDSCAGCFYFHNGSCAISECVGFLSERSRPVVPVPARRFRLAA